MSANGPRQSPRGVLGPIHVRCATPPTPVAGARIIAGPVVPWDVIGYPTGYPGPVAFARGSVTVAAGVPLLLDHDPRRPIGTVTGGIDSPASLALAFAVAPTPAGDEALTLVEHGARTGLSVGATVYDYELVPADDGPALLVVTAGAAREVSLLTFPAYTGARAALV